MITYIKHFSATIQTESNSIFPMGSTMIFPMPRKFSLQRWSTWELRYSIDIYFSKEFCIFVPTHQVMSYAVRGPLAIRAVELEKEIKAVRASFTSIPQKM